MTPAVAPVEDHAEKTVFFQDPYLLYPTMYLLFPTQVAAQAAIAIINFNMGCPVIGDNGATGEDDPNAQKTTTWSVPILANNGSWVFQKPALEFMPNVVGYTEQNAAADWFTNAP